MANTKGKVNPSVAQVHRPNLAPMQGNTADDSRAHIKGDAAKDAPPKNKRTRV